jgi:hypothetical protein
LAQSPQYDKWVNLTTQAINPILTDCPVLRIDMGKLIQGTAGGGGNPIVHNTRYNEQQVIEISGSFKTLVTATDNVFNGANAATEFQVIPRCWFEKNMSMTASKDGITPPVQILFENERAAIDSYLQVLDNSYEDEIHDFMMGGSWFQDGMDWVKGKANKYLPGIASVLRTAKPLVSSFNPVLGEIAEAADSGLQRWGYGKVPRQIVPKKKAKFA